MPKETSDGRSPSRTPRPKASHRPRPGGRPADSGGRHSSSNGGDRSPTARPDLSVSPRKANTQGGDSDRPEFVPAVDIRDVFRRLIADEIRAGRMTTSRRRRIVRYAAHLGISAVEAGRLVTACRKQVVESGDSHERSHALRMADPSPDPVSWPLKVALLLAAAALLYVASTTLFR